MSVEQNKATLRRLFEEVWNKGNMAVIPELVSPDYYYRTAQGEFKGHEGYEQMITSARNAFPDIHMTVDDVVGEGDKLASRVTLTGTHKGEYMGIAPTGKKVTFAHALFTRYVDGKSAEAISFGDRLSFYQQIGVRPYTD